MWSGAVRDSPTSDEWRSRHWVSASVSDEVMRTECLPWFRTEHEENKNGSAKRDEVF